MEYRNRKPGVVIQTACEITGENWEAVTPPAPPAAPAAPKKTTMKSKKKKKKFFLFKIMGIITNVKKKVTKSDTTMAFVDVEDLSGSIEMVVFPKTLLENSHIIEEGTVVFALCRLDVRDDEPSVAVCEKLYNTEQAKAFVTKKSDSDSTDKRIRKGIFIRFKTKQSEEEKQVLDEAVSSTNFFE